MPIASSLLRSDGGLVLPPDVCLVVAEYVIEDSPKAAALLLAVCKSLRSLLKSYETSITKTLSKGDDRLAYVNALQPLVLSSRVPPGDATVSTLSYEWYLEMRSRSSLIEYLINHEITEMDDDTNGWPTLDVSKHELRQREMKFKRKAFSLLYRLADCTAGVKGTHSIRTAQAHFVEELDKVELSALGCLVEIVGQGFFNITKNTLLASPLADLTRSISPTLSSSSFQPMVPSSTPWNNVNNDNWIRECMCVFEDRVQRFGPYFAWSYVAGSQNRARRPDLWAKSELQQGLDDMNAFELGHTMSYASLQSVVWKVFCRKVNCALPDRWNEARKLVESDMATYKIN